MTDERQERIPDIDQIRTEAKVIDPYNALENAAKKAQEERKKTKETELSQSREQSKPASKQ